jgi:hypothetical protein
VIHSIKTNIHNLQGAQKTQPPKNQYPSEKWLHQLNREFSKEEVQMANKYMKNYPTFLAKNEMQTKTTLRFHLTPLE